MAKIKFKTLIISSQYDELEHLEDYLITLQRQIRFSEDDYSRIMLALSEAVTNAIVHGNKEDPKKKVTIDASAEDTLLTICVTDEGEGFNPEDLPDPLKEENLLNEGGRGVFLIEQYADQTTYSKGGTCLKMEFELELHQN